jgi:glutamyl-tRNA synthetase
LVEPLRDVEWQRERLEQEIRAFCEARGIKLGLLAQPLRAALTGSVASPGIFEVMCVLGREESLGRIADAVGPSG